MKKIISLILAVLLLCSLCGCGGAKVEYRDDVAVADLAQNLISSLSGGSEMAAMKDSYIQGVMGMDLSGYSEYAVYVSAIGTNIDEFGIFKLGSLSASDAQKQIDAYLQMREETWMKEYIPEEYPKLQNAEVKLCGNYIIYVLLSDSERSSALKSFEDSLIG